MEYLSTNVQVGAASQPHLSKLLTSWSQTVCGTKRRHHRSHGVFQFAWCFVEAERPTNLHSRTRSESVKRGK